VPRSEAAWLFKIAENVCRERRRSAWRRNQLELVQDPDGIAGLAVAPQRTHDELAGLADALAELPPNQQRAILLREWQGLSYREIAEQLEVTESAVETLLFRARRSLARKLDRSRGRAWGSIGTAGAWAKSLFGGAASAVVVAGIAVATPAVRHDLGKPSSTKTAVASAAVPTPEPRSQSVTQARPAPAPAKSRAATVRKQHVRGTAPRTRPKRTPPAPAPPAAQAPPQSHGAPPPRPPPNVQVPPVAPPAPPQLPVQLPIDLPPLPPINVPGGVPPLPPLPPLPLP
jgi:hypothetical protein